jgi:CRP-like cAMP-binding protein
MRKTSPGIKSWNKDEVMFQKGDNLNYIYLLVKGLAVCEIMGANGKVLRVDEFRTTDIIGASFAFGNDNQLPYNVIAKEHSKALVVKKGEFKRRFFHDERVMNNLLNIISRWSQRQINRLKLLGINTLRGKVAYFLLECAYNNRYVSYKLDKTQSEMAEMFGVARQSVSRILKEFQQNKWIISKAKSITIIDEKTLRSFI